jgi:hypothetical protein
MKIIHKSDDRVVLEDRPYMMGVTLIAFSLYWAWVALASLLEGSISGLLPLAVFFATLFAFTIFVRLKVIELDRRSATLVVKTKSIRDEKSKTYYLDDVLGVQLEERSTRRSNNTSGRVYRIVFNLRADRNTSETEILKIYPTESWSGGGFGGSQKLRELVDTLSQWLKST